MLVISPRPIMRPSDWAIRNANILACQFGAGFQNLLVGGPWHLPNNCGPALKDVSHMAAPNTTDQVYPGRTEQSHQPLLLPPGQVKSKSGNLVDQNAEVRTMALISAVEVQQC
jgi:hypothetical protein